MLVLDAPLLVAEAGLPEVEENRFGMVEKTGRETPLHRLVVLEVTQHESVAFWALARQ